MTASWLPPLLEEIGRRRFAFHPPVANVGPNDWKLGGVSPTSVRVVNSITGLEVVVPRQLVGAVTEDDGPLLVVGLAKELEFRAGAAWPRERRVIEMPRFVESVPASEDGFASRRSAGGPAPVVGIRLERSWDTTVGRFLLISGVGVALVSILTVGVLRDWVSPSKVVFRRAFRSELGLNSSDDYRAVTQKLGLPVTDRIAKVSSEEQFRALTYPQLRVTVLLVYQMDRPGRYVGAVDPDWRIVHWVGSENAKTMLRRVPHS